jgi:hypothetical protein
MLNHLPEKGRRERNINIADKSHPSVSASNEQG